MDTPEYKRLLRYFFLNKISKQSFDSHLRLILKNPKDIDYHNKKMSKIFVNAVNAEPVLPVEGYKAKKIKLDYENSVSPSQGSSASKNSTQPVPLAQNSSTNSSPNSSSSSSRSGSEEKSPKLPKIFSKNKSEEGNNRPKNVNSKPISQKLASNQTSPRDPPKRSVSPKDVKKPPQIVSQKQTNEKAIRESNNNDKHDKVQVKSAKKDKVAVEVPKNNKNFPAVLPKKSPVRGRKVPFPSAPSSKSGNQGGNKVLVGKDGRKNR